MMSHMSCVFPTITQNSVLNLVSAQHHTVSCTESILVNRLNSVSHLSLWICVFLKPLMSKVDPGVLAYLINLPTEFEVRYEVYEDSSAHLLSPGSVSVWPEVFHLKVLFCNSLVHLCQRSS